MADAEEADRLKQQADELKRQADLLKDQAEREKAEARRLASQEKASLDAEQEREIQRLRDYYQRRKSDVDWRYGLS